MTSKKAKAILVCLLAAVATALVASPALAAEVRPHWLIEKTELAEGKEEAAKAKGGEITYEFDAIKVVCKKVEITSAVLIGPSSQQATIAPTSCSVSGQPKCEVATGAGHYRERVVYGPHKEEIHLEIWYSEEKEEKEPFTEGLVFTVTIKGEGCVVAGKYEIRGSTIAVFEPSKPKEEVKVAKMKFNGKEAPKGEYEDPANGKVELAGKLKVGGSEVTVKAEIEEELVSGKSFGAT